MKRLTTLLLCGFAAISVATAQEVKTFIPGYEQEYQGAVERISQRLKAATAKLEAGDSTALAAVASLESSMAFVLIQSKEDYQSALPWVRRCIARNVQQPTPAFKADIAKAYTMMALYYDRGFAGFEKNPKKAFEWFQKAAAMGDPQGMFEVGMAYQVGEVVAADQKKAFEWWLASAKNDGYEAYRNVAIGYYLGDVVKRDYAQAVRWAEKGVGVHDEYCAFMLGLAYYKGQGVKQDYNKAFKFFSLSAEQGEPSAFQAVAECYYYGRGVKRDYEQAKAWCQRGVVLEDEEAIKFMKKLKNK